MTKTTEQFILELLNIYGTKYDYSKVIYKNNHTKVILICSIHGKFLSTPQCLLRGHGCPECGKETKLKKAIDKFLQKANKIHKNKYNYSKMVYKGAFEKICIICPIHGEFWLTPRNHILGCGCSKCKQIHLKYTLEDFIAKSRLIHGDKYDYSKVNFINFQTKVCIICPEHGEFWQSPQAHMLYGCQKCAHTKMAKRKRDTKESFINKARKIHGDYYDYSEVEYIDSQTPVKIKCPIHGFYYCTPNHHLNGRKCPKCSESQLEYNIRKYLESLNINFEQYKRFEWLGKKSLDFYLPEYNVGVECQGRQHFDPVEKFGGYESFLTLLKSDQEKLALCLEHNIKIYYYSELKIEYPYLVYTDKIKMLKEIIERSNYGI